MIHFRTHFKPDNEFNWLNAKKLGPPNYDGSFYEHFRNLTDGQFVTFPDPAG